MKRYIGALAVGTLTLLALACAPAQEPEAAPVAEATTAAEATAAPEATAVPKLGEVSTEGRYVERAGLRLFVPEGFEFGGPIIPPDPRPPRYGGAYVRTQGGDPPSIDPDHTLTSYMYNLVGTVYDRLIHIPTGPGTDPFLDVKVPGLAESWEVSEDFQKYTFHLRKGVQWHNLPPVNGRELDAEDVKFTWDLFRSEGSVNRGFFVDVDQGEVVDRYTVAMHMKRASPGMLSNFADVGRGFILPRESANFNRRITAIGTGPFMVVKEYEYKVGILERRNPDYWVKDKDSNRLPYLDGFRTVIIPDNTARMTALRTGKVDEAWDTVRTPADVQSLMRTNPTFLVQERPGLGATPLAMGIRLDKDPWKDVRVRRALSLAINYEEWSQATVQVPFNGRTGFPGLWVDQPDQTVEQLTKDCGCPWYTYDPQRAKALLGEAGYPRGFTAVVEYYPYGQSLTEQFELAGAYAREIGVNFSIKSLDLTVFRPDMTAGRWADLTYQFMVPAPSSIYGAVQHLVPGHPNNATMGWINDSKLTALVKEFEASFSDEARLKELMRQMRAHFLDQVYSIPMPAGRSYTVIAPRVRNYQLGTHPIVSSDFRNTIHAWIDDDWSFAK